jgi:hypothetical protein
MPGRYREPLNNVLRTLDKFLVEKPLLIVISLYKIGLSWLFTGSCRFVPSCSSYAVEAIHKYGGVRGFLMALRRIARCHPFHPGGFDPVP